MSAEFRKQLNRLIYGTVVLFIFINGCSWMPGYGGRNDRQPGMEVERYFGWPACFRAELWQSDHLHEVNISEYIPPVPLSSEMAFVYSSNALIPLLLDAVFAVSVTCLCVLLTWSICHARVTKRMVASGLFLVMTAWLIVKFANVTNAYL